MGFQSGGRSLFLPAGFPVTMAYFTYRQRKYTMALSIEGCLRANGSRPDMSAFVDFLRKDLRLDMEAVAGVQFNDVMSGRMALVRMKGEEQVEEFERKLGVGVAWSVCGGRMVTGFRCDSAVVSVRILYASYEVSQAMVEEVLGAYGEVREVRVCTMKAGDSTFRDGTILAKVKLNEGVRELPCWVKREEKENCPAEVWRLQHNNQSEPGCWNCGLLGHIGRRCHQFAPPRRFGGDGGGGRPQVQRNVTFAQAAGGTARQQREDEERDRELGRVRR